MGKVLVAALRGDQERAVTAARTLGPAERELAEAAAFHGVAPAVHRALGGGDAVSTDVTDALRDEFLRVVMTRQQVLADLADITSTLGSAGVEFLVVKGPSLAEVVYPDPLLRAYHDLDLVVRPAHLPRAVDALEGDGHVLVDANWDLLLARRPGEVHLTAPAGTVVDLHWNLLNAPDQRERCGVRTEDLFDRSVESVLGASSVRTLAPVDRLVYVALHACSSGGDRLVWVNDVGLCAGVESLDWSEVEARAAEWKVRTPLALMLARASRVRGEGGLARHVHPNPYCWLDVAAGRMPPLEQTMGGRSPSRLVARAARDGAVTSAAELVRHGASWVRQGAHLRQHDRIDRDPGSEYSPLHSSGGEAGRREFLAAVAAGSM
jgi:hypothetical protein